MAVAGATHVEREGDRSAGVVVTVARDVGGVRDGDSDAELRTNNRRSAGVHHRGGPTLRSGTDRERFTVSRRRWVDAVTAVACDEVVVAGRESAERGGRGVAICVNRLS